MVCPAVRLTPHGGSSDAVDSVDGLDEDVQTCVLGEERARIVHCST